MRAPDEYFDERMPITPREFQLGMTLYFLAQDNLQVTVPHQKLEELMGVSTETIRVATLGLREKGLLDVQRKRRNRGFLSFNKYILMADIDIEMRAFRDSRRAEFLDWKYSAEGRRVQTSKNYVETPLPTIEDTKTGMKAELNYLVKRWREDEMKKRDKWTQTRTPWGF